MDPYINTLICGTLGLYLGLAMGRFSSTWLANRRPWFDCNKDEFRSMWTIFGAIIGFAGAGIPAFMFGISIGLVSLLAAVLASLTLPILVWAVLWSIDQIFSSSMELGERLAEMVDKKFPPSDYEKPV